MEAKTPNTLLAAARLVDPCLPWYIDSNGKICAMHEEDGRIIGFSFFSLDNLADAFALEGVLMEEGNGLWGFRKALWSAELKSSGFCAISFKLNRSVFDRDRGTLLLKCVETLEAMK